MRLGFILALFFLGLGMHARAQGSPIQRKAWAGDSVAMMTLSEAFTFGSGVPQNDDSAKYYIRKSAEKGYREGMYLYGTELMTKVFSEKEFASGVQWVDKAAKAGLASAQYRLCQEYTTNNRDNVSDKYYDLKKAYTYGDLAAQQGHPEALMYCAEARLKGSGTTKSDSVAVAYFRRAADEKKFVPAMLRTGDMFWEGKVTGKVEPFLAKEWYEKALMQPHSNLDQKSQANLGLHHIDQFFKRIQNTYLNANPALPVGLYDYRYR